MIQCKIDLETLTEMYAKAYRQGKSDAIDEVIAMFKAEFDKQNRINSLFVPTVVINENIYIDLEQLKKS